MNRAPPPQPNFMMGGGMPPQMGGGGMMNGGMMNGGGMNPPSTFLSLSLCSSLLDRIGLTGPFLFDDSEIQRTASRWTASRIHATTAIPTPIQ